MDLKAEIIGYVSNRWESAEPYQADAIKDEISVIEVKEEFSDALLGIENYPELNILFWFDRSKGYELRTTTRSGNYRGVFACCTPRRPTMIGLTTVQLIKVEGNRLTVTGLDALNGTPVVDIKPVVSRP
jgi:formylmethanofuran dehydrogenase subunit E